MGTQRIITRDVVPCFVAQFSFSKERKPRLENLEPSNGVR